jgi:hypothetical protein
MLVLGFQTAQMTISANLAGISQEESLCQPAQAGNCVNWLAGHLLSVRCGLSQILGIPVSSSLSEAETNLYKQGSAALTPAGPAVPLERLLQDLQSSNSALVAHIQGMSEEQFDAPLDPKMFPMPVPQPNAAALLTLFLFHEAYHSGQIGLGRRLLGKSSGMGV